MITDIDNAPEETTIGQAVEVFFDDIGDGFLLPRFRTLATGQ
ncbi:hypothetical protein HNP40_003144 [Mycobacteroides chelonae]|nr:hypothetical protein [Mycobacteroides chelonae]